MRSRTFAQLLPRVFAQLLVSAIAVIAAVLGIGQTAAAAAVVCKTPKPWPVPASGTVVGTGTAKSCTQSALRSAVAAGGRVTFNCGDAPVTISVTKEMKVRGTTIIDGGGKVTLSGRKKNRILVPQSGVRLSVRNLRMINGAAAKTLRDQDRNDRGKGGAIAGGYRTFVEVINSTFVGNFGGAGGGAIYVGTDSSLSIVGSTFKGNRTNSFGGAVFSMLSPLTVINSKFTKNSSKGGGGAIGTDGASAPARRNGTVRICGSVISHNTGKSDGGGVFLWTYAPERIVIDRTTFEGNKANPGLGGGARLSTGDGKKKGSITVTRSTFRSNTGGGGGGMYVNCAPTCKIRNSTFYGNHAKSFGGAIMGDRHHDDNVTFARNVADNQGGALFGGKYVLNNTVFVGNSAHNPWGFAMNCNSTGTGRHVIQWLTTSRDNATKCIPHVIAKNPRLGALANNGGPTLTMMPAAKSPVLNAGSRCLATDQRGVARPTGNCALGAVERVAADTPGNPTPTPSPTASPVSKAGLTRTAGGSTPGASAQAIRPVGDNGPLPSGPSAGVVLITIIGTGVGVLAMLVVNRSSRRTQGGHRRG